MNRSSREFIDIQSVEYQQRSLIEQNLFGRMRAQLIQLMNRTPRVGQVECIWHIWKGSQDILFQAATGYGKSAIWQFTSLIGLKCFNQRSITLMISPLVALTRQHVEVLERITHGEARGIALYAGHNTNEMYHQIGLGVYTHSPEIACSRRFSTLVLQQQIFRGYRIILMVDEVHTVAQWQTWRKDLGKLSLLRQRLPPNTIAFGTSATLDPDIRDSVVEYGPFRKGYTFIDTTTDRPEIYIELRPLVSTKVVWLDLRFLFPQTVEDSRSIRKAIIYFDNRRQIRSFLEVARFWLVAAGLTSDDATTAVRAFYAPMPRHEKEAILQDFQESNSVIRIILATDAMGMGIELAGVEVVVQYDVERRFKVKKSKQPIQSQQQPKVPQSVRDHLNTIWQRKGRAARRLGENGHFIWIVPSWVLNQKQTRYQPSRLGISQTHESNGAIREEQSDSARWRELHLIYQEISTSCVRDRFFEFYHEADTRIRQLPRLYSDRCCSYCHPDLRYPNLTGFRVDDIKQLITKIGVEGRKNIRSRGIDELLCLPSDIPLPGRANVYGKTVLELRKWRNNLVNDEYEQNKVDLFEPHNILSDRCIDRIASLASWLTPATYKQILSHFVPDFEFCDEYGEEIFGIVADICQCIGVKDEGKSRTVFRKEDVFLVKQALARSTSRLVQRTGHGEVTQDDENGSMGQTDQRLLSMLDTPQPWSETQQSNTSHEDTNMEALSHNIDISQMFASFSSAVSTVVANSSFTAIVESSEEATSSDSDSSSMTAQKRRSRLSRSRQRTPHMVRREQHTRSPSPQPRQRTRRITPSTTIAPPVEQYQTKSGRVSRSSPKAIGKRTYLSQEP